MSLLQPPSVQPLASILPAEPLLLMGAGPVPIPYAVERANSIVINHLGPTMDRVLESVRTMSRYAFQTTSPYIFGISGPASAAMEMAVTNLAWPGRRVLALKGGVFSGRFAEMAEGVGASVDVVESSVAQPISAQMVRAAFKQRSYDVVTVVHGETSCGVLNVEMPEIARIASEHGALVIADAVCTLSALPVQSDEWGLDAVVAGGQKGLSSIPGVSLVSFSERAWEAVKRRPRPCPHWCVDALRAEAFWGKRQYHYTAPVPGLLALYEALRLIVEETLQVRFRRHLHSSQAFQAGIEAMGLQLFVPPEHRLNSVLAIRVPSGVDASRVRDRMSTQFGVEIAGAFGLEIVRVGQMGEQCRSHHLFRTLYAMGTAFLTEGVSLDVAGGMAELEKALAGTP
jgi:alanine-glyoxylate transaminase / serine-glyoxylate transaminase / serine-pyruvate transaminase